ncbi:hypothetical protein [Streptomyces sirii]|uniref:hypothetical protein n=1 Tax=Streptomyces sirii TaxID=3127701 RepID=UPI003D35CA5B
MVSLAAVLLAGGAATAILMNRPPGQHAATPGPHALRQTPPDAVMQTPDNRNQYWVFSGGRYAQIEIADGGHTDKLVVERHPLSDWKDSFPRAEERAR